MKIFVCCSKSFYDKVIPIKEYLEIKGHEITLPNSHDDPGKEHRIMKESSDEHRTFKGEMIRLQGKKVSSVDAVLVLNYNKNGIENYIGGATFLEMFKAFELNKKLFLINPIPNGILRDEILGFNPIVINGDLELIKWKL